VNFETIRLANRFPELYGFVLLDPARLDAFYEGKARGENLLQRFSETDDGDRVSAEGIAIPLVAVDEGDYTVLIRDAAAPALGPDPKVRSTGWVLGTETGELLFSGIGYLWKWNPDDPGWAAIRLTPGWYGVEVLGYVLNEGKPTEEWAFEFALTPASARPAFAADVSAPLSLGQPPAEPLPGA
jgi:hypothetical protein